MDEGVVRTIYVDLDQTLVRVDLLTERLLLAMARNPAIIFQGAFWLLNGGRPRLKTEIARRCSLDVAHLPYNEELLAFLKEERQAGQALVLATAAPSQWAKAIARHLAIFDRVLATDEKQGNLKGLRKLEAIQKDCGGKAFGYAGDAPCDRPIFEAAKLPIVVGTQIELAGERTDRAVLIRPNAASASAWWRSLRPLLWSKNLLIFAPLLAAHRLDKMWSDAFVAFLAFSLAASALYLLNDFFDLDADRRHPRKRLRSLASGNFSPVSAIGLAALLAVAAAIVVGFLLPLKFSLVLAGYAFVNLLYSANLKKVVILDLVLLALLTCARVFAGGAACNIHVSTWLFAFIFFFALSLAHLKRYTEIRQSLPEGIAAVARPKLGEGKTSLLVKVGFASGLLSVLVLALYITSPQAVALYRVPMLLFVVCALLFYWVERIWFRASHEKITDDPVVFIMIDPISYLVAFASIVIILLAAVC